MCLETTAMAMPPLPLPCPLRTTTRPAEALANSSWAQTSLLVVTMLAGNMILSDGVLTPAISVVGRAAPQCYARRARGTPS